MKKTTGKISAVIDIILCILCLIYSAVVLSANSGTFSFLIWIAGGAYFFLCFVFFHTKLQSRLPKAFKVIFNALSGIGISVFALCFCLILSGFRDSAPQDLDLIIVPGAQMRSSGPSIVYLFRLEKACAYLKDNENTICITTGGKGSNEPVAEGQGGMDYLISRGISPERLLPECESVNTFENIENALALLENKGIDPNSLNIGIVTNNFHTYRCVHIAKRLSKAKIYGIPAYAHPVYLPNNIARECFGVLKDTF